MLLTIRNWLVSLPARIEQREILLVLAHGQDQAFLRHGQEFRFELADVDRSGIQPAR